MNTAFPLFVAAAGIAVSTALDDPTLKMISLCLAGFGIFACLPVFWTLPTAFLSGAAAAAGIAVVNVCRTLRLLSVCWNSITDRQHS